MYTLLKRASSRFGLTVALAGAVVLGLGSGAASASAFFVDFDDAPSAVGGNPTQFDSGGFTFTFGSPCAGCAFGLADGSGGPFTGSGISARSDGTADALFAIELAGGGTFFFGSIFINSIGPTTTIEGILVDTVVYTLLPFVEDGTDRIVPSGFSAQLVDTVRLSSPFYNELRFDSFAGELVAIPLPAALPLYGTGLAVMGFLGWRRKRKAAAGITDL